MKRLRTSATRNVILFGIMIAVLAVLMVLTRPVVMMPPEPPELAAKRAAPENAYSLLMEAKGLLPAPPPPLMLPAPANPALSVAYRAEDESLGHLLNVCRPEDDPEFIKYIAACAPVAAKAREALRKSYYLIPIDWTKRIEWGSYVAYVGVPPDNIYPLVNVVSVLGVIQTREPDTEAEGFACLLDAARLGLLIARDPADFFYGFQAFYRSLERVRETTLAGDPSLQVLCDTLAALRKLQTELPDPAARLEYLWRRIDNVRYSITSFPGSALTLERRQRGIGKWHYKTTSQNASLDDWFEFSRFLLTLRREKREVIKNRDAFLEVARFSFPDYVTWSRQRPTPMTDGPIGTIGDVVLYRTHTEISFNATVLVVALEMYRLDHGVYPDTLGALTPHPLETLPMDPCRGGKDTPFHYRREGDDYVLYSVGSDLIDDGGKTWQYVHPPERAEIKPQRRPLSQSADKTRKQAPPQESANTVKTWDWVFHAPAASESTGPTK